MTTLKPLYGTNTALACTTTALASDTNLLSGRTSAAAVNSTDLADDSLLGGTIATTGTPTAGTVIEVWLYGSWNGGTNYSAGAGGTDAAFSPATLGVKQLMVLATVVNQTDTTARTYPIGPLSVAQAFGGTMPDHWGFYVVQNTGTTLGATTMSYTPVQYQNV